MIILKHSVLFINPPNNTAPPETLDPPLGLSYIASILIKMKHDVYGIDLNFEKNARGKLNKLFNKKDIDIVGLTSVTSNYNYVKKISEYIRKMSQNVLIMYGGTHATFNKEKILSENNSIDLVVYGEGELTIQEVIKNYPNLFENKIRGIAYRRDGKIVINPPRELISNIDTIPLPYREIFTKRKYSQIHILTSRGCPYNCIFCNSTKMWGNRIRYRNIKCVIEEIEKIQGTFGRVKIFIADDVFLMDKKRVYEFCTEIAKKELYFSWACLSRVDSVSEKLLKRMKECGCKEISFGCESGSNKILEICNKNITTKDIINAIRITKKVGISCRTSWIIGLPCETEDTLSKTTKLILKTKPNIVTFYFAIPYSGTDLQIRKKELNMTLLTADPTKYYSGNREPVIIPKDFELTKLKLIMDEMIEILKNNGYEISNNTSDIHSDLVVSTNFTSSSMHWRE